MHHYPGLDYRKIKRMTLKQVTDAVNDVPFVNPMCAGESESEEDKRGASKATPEDRAGSQIARYGGIDPATFYPPQT